MNDLKDVVCLVHEDIFGDCELLGYISIEMLHDGYLSSSIYGSLIVDKVHVHLIKQ